jgi:hypothetical protein
MIWTKDKPTKPGEWYWWRYRNDRGIPVYIPESGIAEMSGGKRYRNSFLGGEWSSEPIPRPEGI